MPALDRTLARYGSEAAEIRAAMKPIMSQRVEVMWPADLSRASEIDNTPAPQEVEGIAARIRALKPQTDEQRWLQSRALELGDSLFQRRSLIVASIGSSIPLPFLGILLFWLTIAFAIFGLFAPSNATVISVLLVCALSVAGAVFLVLEMDSPFQGLIRVTGEPLRFAAQRLTSDRDREITGFRPSFRAARRSQSPRVRLGRFAARAGPNLVELGERLLRQRNVEPRIEPSS